MLDLETQWFISYIEEYFQETEHVDFLNRIHKALPIRECLRKVDLRNETTLKFKSFGITKNTFRRVEG